MYLKSVLILCSFKLNVPLPSTFFFFFVIVLFLESYCRCHCTTKKCMTVDILIINYKLCWVEVKRVRGISIRVPLSFYPVKVFQPIIIELFFILFFFFFSFFSDNNYICNVYICSFSPKCLNLFPLLLLKILLWGFPSLRNQFRISGLFDNNIQ